jgi:hypothetical protein
MGNLEGIIMLMEVDEDEDLEEYDWDITFDDTSICERCGKEECPKKDDEYGAEDGVYHCYKCREEITIEEYFNSLKSKGLLEEYGSWIIKTYPNFKKYLDN